MDLSETTLSCTVRVEWLNSQGTVLRKVSYKNGAIRLIRDTFRIMFIEVSAVKESTVRLELKSINVHKKFMAEGKASIVFQEIKCTLYLSNAPPANLLAFLRTMFVKMTGSKGTDPANSSLRTQLLSKTPAKDEEISPVSIADLHTAKEKATRGTTTTPSPSRKRKLSENRGPAAKRLYSESPLPDEPLNSEQKTVLDACLAGHNVFFTGSAGTGKSYLLKKIISVLPPDVTVATASTGVAACHIGGITLHSFAGIGTGDAELERCYKLALKPHVAQLWRRTKHLIIDEISMIDGLYFGKLEAVARYIRKNDRPFGGIQLILCGDFLQLPPVNKTAPDAKQPAIKFCFQSPAWGTCVQTTFELKRVHRQTDAEFVEILNNIRIGRVTSEIADRLAQTAKQKIEINGIVATQLCSQNADADIINESKLNQLPGEAKVFIAQDNDEIYTKQLNLQTPVPGKLKLKVGAQVMLLKNINLSNGLVNGARGIVVSFKDNLPVVRFRNSTEYVAKHEKWVVKTASGAVLARLQVPLKLAWAFSIHKSQGLTLDCVEMSLARVFEAGQAYVALSRAQSLESLRVLDFNQKQVWANSDVLKFHHQLRQRIENTRIVPLGKKISVNKSKPKLLYKSKPLVSIK